MYLMTFPNGTAVVENDGSRVVVQLAKDKKRRAFEVSVDEDGLVHLGREAHLGPGELVAEVMQHELLVENQGVASGSITNQVGTEG